MTENACKCFSNTTEESHSKKNLSRDNESNVPPPPPTQEKLSLYQSLISERASATVSRLASVRVSALHSLGILVAGVGIVASSIRRPQRQVIS